MQTVKDPSTGATFPLTTEFWHGGTLRCLGAGCRTKKLGGLIGVKVYAVALYVDAGAAAAAAGGRHVQDSGVAQVVLEDGAFTQALQMRLVRGVSGKQFTDALDESLRPVMSGDEATLDQFCAYFAGKQLDKGAEITLLRRPEGPTDVCLRPPTDSSPYSSAQPGLTITSPRLGQALRQLYLGPQAPAPEARKTWLTALTALVAQVAES